MENDNETLYWFIYICLTLLQSSAVVNFQYCNSLRDIFKHFFSFALHCVLHLAGQAQRTQCQDAPCFNLRLNPNFRLPDQRNRNNIINFLVCLQSGDLPLRQDDSKNIIIITKYLTCTSILYYTYLQCRYFYVNMKRKTDI